MMLISAAHAACPHLASTSISPSTPLLTLNSRS
jgi:hypothetical protein